MADSYVGVITKRGEWEPERVFHAEGDSPREAFRCMLDEDYDLDGYNKDPRDGSVFQLYKLVPDGVYL